jgi:hypothetical protein
MQLVLKVIGKVLIGLGLFTVFIISAVTVGIMLGASLAVFDGEIDGKSVTGIGLVKDPQVETSTITSEPVNNGV